jgi:hypothetical protein
MANFNALVSCPNSGPAGSTNSVQINAGTGTFSGVGPLTNGQLIVGSTGNAPQAATLTAGSGVSITNGAGSITISSSASTAFQREFGPYSPPAASIFTLIDTPNGVTPTVTDVSDVGLVYSVPITTTNQFPGAYTTVPGGSWTLTVRTKYSLPMGQFPTFGVWVRDSAGKMVGAAIEGNNAAKNLLAQRLTSSTVFSANPYSQAVAEAPNWFRVGYDGTNIRFSVSWDGQSWLAFYTETKTAFLNGTIAAVGIGGAQRITTASQWLAGSQMGATVTYWNLQ